MQVRFLLGPAGSGKTWRCLAEIRAALKDDPEGDPLILLAPKQATFQLERQLLADPALAGFARLQILSFERLAGFVLDEARVAAPSYLSEEGRVMVLRALLMRHEADLQLFRRSARRAGFARQLSRLLEELQQHQVTHGKLREWAARRDVPRELRDKLLDLATLLEAYRQWSDEHSLQDGNHLLDLAAELLGPRRQPPVKLKMAHLWLDGFAEMTPQELDLLMAVLPHCDGATLAFCLDASGAEAAETGGSWLSIWSAVGRLHQQCRQRAALLPGAAVTVEFLARDSGHNRFVNSPALQRLEQGWAGKPAAGAPLTAGIRLAVCPHADAEATLAARTILKLVREGRRFRDCAVLVRNLESYHKAIARSFRRYGIPFFLDRRESIAHHPLAELARSALRTVAFDWQPEDWFGALKAGFSTVDETDIDRLENESLARGWHGKKWREPIQVADNPSLTEWAERMQQKIMPPFTQLARRLGVNKSQPTGTQLAEALRQLWSALKVADTLEHWSTAGVSEAAIHSTVREQMNAWLDNVELAFAGEALPLRDWLPILDAGLAGLTVGVIPPALDQVLVGAIDRARNPELKLTLVLGLNEGVFPATPAPPAILTEDDRAELNQRAILLGPDLRERLARERFYGYIACTRSSEQLLLVYSRHDATGKALNPSPFIGQVQRMFPGLEIESIESEIPWAQAETAGELAPTLIGWAQSALERGPATARTASTSAGEPSLDHPEGPAPRAQLRTAPDCLAADVLKVGQASSLSDERASASVILSGTPGAAGADPNARAVFSPDRLEACPTSLALSVPGAVSRCASASAGRRDLLALPVLAEWVRRLEALREPDPTEALSPAMAQKLYGPTLRSSVSRLEEFAACPFRFFVKSGLQAGERKVFELDARERGNFQHDVLKVFHERLQAENRRWRDLTPLEAREKISGIAAELMTDYRDGLFRESAKTLFAARAMTAALQDFVEILVAWQRNQCEFDPALAEAAFDDKPGARLPAWKIPLGRDFPANQLSLHGRIDRVDIWRDPSNATALAAVIDYKSSGKKLDAILVEHGVQLQLLAYLNVLRHWPQPDLWPGLQRIEPAGVFYVNLRGAFESGGTRDEILAEAASERQKAYRHTGRFDASRLPQLDRAGAADQFNYRRNSDGSLRKGLTEALPAEEFIGLLDRVETQLIAMGRRIFSGDAAVDPYRKGAATPCEFCDFQPVCRIDPWTHKYRRLRTAVEPAGTGFPSLAAKAVSKGGGW